MASYVAVTRVEKREDLLIYRPFDPELFTRDPPEGPITLLLTLRGEDIDWKAIEEKYTPLCRAAVGKCTKKIVPAMLDKPASQAFKKFCKKDLWWLDNPPG